MRHLFRRQARIRFRHQLLFLQARLMKTLSNVSNELSSMCNLYSRQMETILVETDSTIAQYLQQVDKYDALARY